MLITLSFRVEEAGLLDVCTEMLGLLQLSLLCRMANISGASK